MVVPEGWADPHAGRLQALVELGGEASRVTLDYFQSDQLQVDLKSDASPVTVADREAERRFRDRILAAFGEDAVLGEEHGDVEGKSGYRWVIDPIDGTKSFIGGVPMYSTLLALEFEGEPIAGGIWIPAMGESVVACRGYGCWHQRPGQDGLRPARVSSREDLSRAIFVTTAVASFADVGGEAAFERLQRDTWFTRTWGDGYGYLLVATGRADLMVDPIVNAWDVAAIAPVVDEAGGRFTDWSGVSTVHSGNAVGTNGLLHEAVLQRLGA